ncbi:Mannose-binding protein C [Amphibalanus amphitrite]|uniref:Mannose-binding protein C n=1 Tax=Amphibalanus amphitrite TaxID=1232801 RepID=A0A6A4WX00_AMPAM|nr:Mannose-binding protein C [Amphibalanus amphitrite]
MCATLRRLSLLSLSVLTLASKSQFTKKPVQFTDSPVSSFAAPSRLFCSAKCQRQEATACGGFVYGDDGMCHLYNGRNVCEGPATPPDEGQPTSERWIRSVCAGTIGSRCSCPPGFTRCAGRCYRRIGGEVIYATAQSQCAALGAHLAVPRSEAENQCAINLAVGDDVWLGVTDEVTEGTWMGKDTCGRVSPPAAWWNLGEPNNWGDTNDADCIYIHFSGKWADWDCPTLSFPLCQLWLCHREDCV